ncbi:hypothetical protein DM2_2349 [Halorubrum sp. DM2]|nr:hypothetical protein DM2_2349 [Halorubrum sp. DM2]
MIEPIKIIELVYCNVPTLRNRIDHRTFDVLFAKKQHFFTEFL